MFWNVCLWIYEFSAFCVALLLLSGCLRGVKLLKEKAKRENRTLVLKSNLFILFNHIVINWAMILIPLWNTICAFCLVIQYDRFITDVEEGLKQYQFPSIEDEEE